MATTSLYDRIEPLLAHVERPARYVGSEFGARTAVRNVEADVSVGLCYPGTYEVGQANQALHLLYARLVEDPTIAVERVFLPWVDLIEALREHDIPLFTLESFQPVSELDILGITLPNELAATSTLEVLDLARIPLHADERDESHPLVIGGGPCALNPEPLAPFFDAFFIGEADTAITEIVEVVRRVKATSASRDAWLDALAAIESMYVPARYDLARDEPIKKRLERAFDDVPLPTTSIVPFVDVVHDRIALEIQRGCNRGCRFCQAGMVARPARERSADTIVRAALQAVEETGYEEVSLTSLSSTDHSQIADIVRRLNGQLSDSAVSISLPSLRVDTFSIELMDTLLSGAKRPGLTLAPEAGTQRMRDVINKNVTEQQLLDTVCSAFASGYRRIKLYFMIGLPHETDEDVVGIADLVRKVADVAYDAVEPRQRSAVKVALSVSTFVPKAHTPFQWAAQIPVEEMKRRQQLLRDALPRKGVQLSYHEAYPSFIEGLIARGDRTLAPVIEQAWRQGARFEAYREQFDPGCWEWAFETCGFDPSPFVGARAYTDDLAWRHIDVGVDTDYLVSEAQHASEATLTRDCTFAGCTNCGVCPNLATAPEIRGERA